MAKKMRASVFMARRTELLTQLADIDAQIDKQLSMRRTNKCLEGLRTLFAERSFLADELDGFGVAVEAHPSVCGEVMENGEDWLSEAVYAYDRGEWLQSVAAALIGLVAER